MGEKGSIPTQSIRTLPSPAYYILNPSRSIYGEVKVVT